MTLSLKKRENNYKGCILVDRIKKFFVSTFLSTICLLSFAPVFAGNGQSSNQMVANDICIRLSFIERKILFETTTQLLNDLNLVFVFLKSMEAKLNFEQKNLILEQFKSVLYKQEFSDRIKKSSIDERNLYDSLSCKVSDAVLIRVPPRPQLRPKKFVGEINEWVWSSSSGTEDIRMLNF